MLKYILKRLGLAVIILLGVSVIIYALVRAMPVDFVENKINQMNQGGATISQDVIDAMYQMYGITDRTFLGVLSGYWSWLTALCRFDLGKSFVYGDDVLKVIVEHMGVSFLVSFIAIIFEYLIAIPLGITAATHQYSVRDYVVTVLVMIGLSLPSFFFGRVLQNVFSMGLGWFPTGLSVPIGVEAAQVTALDRLRHAVLPALTLSVTGMSSVALHTREKMVDIMESDYVLFARARGESPASIALGHGLRNVALPALTLQFASVSEIIGGSVLVEQVFSYPGLGQAAVDAGLGSDLPLFLGITVLTAAIVFGGNLAADLLYGAIDPRIRRGAART